MSRAPHATALPWALLLLGEVPGAGCGPPRAASSRRLLITRRWGARPASPPSSPTSASPSTRWTGTGTASGNHGSCSHTRREREPWWSVDLGGRRAVAAVVVKNRQDCCWERLRGAQVHVGDAPAERGRFNPVCGTITDAGPGSLSTICCAGLPGRYVSILIPGREDALVLCEVEVVLQGCLPLPGGWGRPVAQSSTLNAISLAANAVDGNGDADWEAGSCAHTEKELEPWWRVDLGRRYTVDAVTVTNRRDCCWESLLGAQVHVGDSLADHGKRNPVCGAILETGPGSTSTVCCNGLPGRYVSVIIPGREDFLVLCEVEVTAQRAASPRPAGKDRKTPPAGSQHVPDGRRRALTSPSPPEVIRSLQRQEKLGRGREGPRVGDVDVTRVAELVGTSVCRDARAAGAGVTVPWRPPAQNLALRRLAAQSSTAGRAGQAVNAVDGNRDGNWRHGSCSQTKREPEPWWTVDLGRRRAVEAVVVRNRLDCCWHRLKGARVHVGDSLAGHGTNNPVCGTITDTSPGSTSTVCCRGLRGRYVTITVPGREERLSLCEVEVVEQAVAANAVDGNRDSNWEHGSCAHTTEEPEPWWRVDLSRRHAVYAVVVKNRHDCCWERLKGAEIHRRRTPWSTAAGATPSAASLRTPAPGSLSTVCCHGLRGRYVSILIPGREDALVLCEVEVIRQGCAPLPGAPNVAREQRATQSSTSNGSGVASKAVDGNRDGVWQHVDGNRDGVWQHGSCSHTRREREPWWSVDLGGRRAVAAVVVKNRQDCCWERLRGAQVHVGDAPAERGRFNPVCGTITDAGPGSLSTICCAGLPGRYVSILIPGREDALALCEVEVYSVFPEF
ncbi:LOW QUALITY PROTEIN: uncharacterized protein LOC128141744 [Harpia harpyja]|uniref:LOW QUALITY PROTEIN: uncharacterized protein LOC128141744 n=1 Tax=Harpia harpyja TaxID=202280 RepID=UPI0022B0A178|nr:LOW QUALITY PROTEIN: uncharacterized protein LOC128141744 [Harpia harpyja]